jgi:hypothetical protein
MNSTRKTAVAVGILYILATVAGVLSVAPANALFSAPNMLNAIAANEGQLITVAGLLFIMSIAVAGVALMIYPILKQDTDTVTKKGLALSYLGSRIMEGAIFLVAVLATLALLTLSREFAAAGAPEGSFFQPAGELLRVASDHAGMLGQSVFCIGALMLYGLLYQSKRVPRWLSVWGLIGAPLMLVAGFLMLIDGDPNSTLSTVLYAPLALQEMVLALWLIVKGFSPSTVVAK